MSNLNLFVPIKKVDVARREVWGRLVQEVPDKSGEIFDYASSVPHFKAWSEEFQKATGHLGDEKSHGNLRAMHGKTAAGKFIAINYNDAEKAIDVGSKVVDDNEWKKVLEGVYTGYSIGGSYVGEKKTEKIDGKDVKRYTAAPAEGSLVDSPCVPTARFFDIVKADGVVEKAEFKTAAVPEVQVAGSASEVEALGKALNDNKMTMKDALEAVQLLVEKRAAKPIEKSEEEKLIEKAIAVGVLIKRVGDPELTLIDLADIAKAELTDEERKPLKSIDEVKKAIIDKLSKGMSAADKDRLQAAHDHISAMGASCGAGKSHGGDLSKAEVAALVERVTKLEAQPAPHVVLRTVNKVLGEDNSAAESQTDEAWKKLSTDEFSKFVRRDNTVDYDAANKFAMTKAA